MELGITWATYLEIKCFKNRLKDDSKIYDMDTQITQKDGQKFMESQFEVTHMKPNN